MKKLLIVISIFLSSCTTFKDIENGLASYNGMGIQSLISHIGYPSAERNIAGRKLYVWDSRQTVTYSMPSTSTSSGTVYTNRGSGYYSGSSTIWIPQTANYFCTITVEVNSSEQIIASQFQGNIGGCERYAKAFRK